MISEFDNVSCHAKPLCDIVNSHYNKELLQVISQRYWVKDAFYNLLVSDRICGIFGCTPWGAHQVFDSGLIMYILYSWIPVLCPGGVALVLGLSLSDFLSKTCFGNLRESSTQVTSWKLSHKTFTASEWTVSKKDV